MRRKRSEEGLHRVGREKSRTKEVVEPVQGANVDLGWRRWYSGAGKSGCGGMRTSSFSFARKTLSRNTVMHADARTKKG